MGTWTSNSIPNLKFISIRCKNHSDPDNAYLTYFTSMTFEIKSHITRSNQSIRENQCVIPSIFIELGPKVWAVLPTQEWLWFWPVDPGNLDNYVTGFKIQSILQTFSEDIHITSDLYRDYARHPAFLIPNPYHTLKNITCIFHGHGFLLSLFHVARPGKGAKTPKMIYIKISPCLQPLEINM